MAKKHSKSYMISKLKSAGVKGSLTRMRNDELRRLMAEHAVEDHGSSHGIVAGSATGREGADFGIIRKCTGGPAL
eukprot:COSAG04_NODE_477_length_13694_cov_3.632310_7_plen_75_part_00